MRIYSINRTVGAGGSRGPHILAGQLTLFKPGGWLSPPHTYLPPRIFRPSYGPVDSTVWSESHSFHTSFIVLKLLLPEASGLRMTQSFDLCFTMWWKRSIFQTFWKVHCCTKSLFFQFETYLLWLLHSTYSWNIKRQKRARMGLNGFIFKKINEN